MDNPASLETNLQMAEIDASVLLEGETPRLIDEWQLAPKLWDAIRFEVDHRHGLDQYIFAYLVLRILRPCRCHQP